MTVTDELERQGLRRGNEIFKPVEIRSIADIQRVLAQLDDRLPAADGSTQAEVVAPDESGKMVVYKLNATFPQQTRRNILLTAFTALRERRDAITRSATPIVVNGREMKPAILNEVQTVSAIDPLVERWLGGTRRGLLICWTLSGWQYKYDIFEHKLTRIRL